MTCKYWVDMPMRRVILERWGNGLPTFYGGSFEEFGIGSDCDFDELELRLIDKHDGYEDIVMVYQESFPWMS